MAATKTKKDVIFARVTEDENRMVKAYVSEMQKTSPRRYTVSMFVRDSVIASLPAFGGVKVAGKPRKAR